MRSQSAKITSDSHSWFRHTASVVVKENGSVLGTAPCATIHRPAATCHQRSDPGTNA